MQGTVQYTLRMHESSHLQKADVESLSQRAKLFFVGVMPMS